MADARGRRILFLCTGNSARSIIGEALINHRGRGKFRGFSAGSFPKGAVNPHALALRRRLKLPVEGSGAAIAAAFAETFRMLERRIRIFTALPLASLSRLELKRRVDEMGARESEPA